MSSRFLLPWRRCAAVFLALPVAAPAATVACAGSPPATFALAIGSGVMRDGRESRIEVQAHADGCVAVHRPWFLRDAGEYELRLGTKEWAALQSTVASDQLGKIDAQRLRVQTGGAWKNAAAETTVFADPDADVITLQWRDGDQSHQLVARDPERAAARQPKEVELNRVAAAVGALRALIARPAQKISAEGTP